MKLFLQNKKKSFKIHAFFYITNPLKLMRDFLSFFSLQVNITRLAQSELKLNVRFGAAQTLRCDSLANHSIAITSILEYSFRSADLQCAKTMPCSAVNRSERIYWLGQSNIHCHVHWKMIQCLCIQWKSQRFFLIFSLFPFREKNE